MASYPTQVTSAQDEIYSLQDAVNSMDGLSQEGFSQICSIANLAMLRLECGLESPGQCDDLHKALFAIRSVAQGAEECISSEAEGVGCSCPREVSVICNNDCSGVKP